MMASCTPCLAQRNANGVRNLGSAVSEDVSEQVWMTNTPKSRATSCTAKAPEEASASIKISQPSAVTSSRATRAASCGWPLESRMISSILRPPKPPLALNFSTSILAALLEDWPNMATLPDKMVGMPTRMGLFCAKDRAGKPRVLTPAIVAAL